MANINPNSPRLLLSGRGPMQKECRMNKRCWIAVAALALLASLPAVGQSQDVIAQEENDTSLIGQVWRNYTVQQSAEVGGRITRVSGNSQMYDTLVNLQSGPRLLSQELSMRPMTRGGGLFDTLYLSSFGFGGDPYDMARLRMEKSHWYSFVALYRRSQNYFNYDLFANPLTLNPGITNCSTVVGGVVQPCTAVFNPKANYYYSNSPHLQATTHNLGDFNLTLFPQSVFSVRLGYLANYNNGTVDSSLEDVNIDLTQQAKVRSDRYSFGLDVRPFARTTFSFDQFFEYDRVDTACVNNPVNPLYAGRRRTKCLATPLLSALRRHCAGSPQPYIPAPGVLNPLCNTGVFGYSRSDNVRSFFPTSQLALRSNYVHNLDITADGTVSSGNSKVSNYNDLFRGEIGRGGTASAYQVTGPANTNRVSGNADLGLTYHFTKSWSVSDKFRWLDWRDPGVFNQFTTNCYTNPAGSAPLSSPITAPCGIAGIPTVGTAAAGLTSNSLVNYNTLEAERTYLNTATLNWSIPRVGAYVGYRYGRRELRTAFLADTTNSPTLAGGLVGPPGVTTAADRPLDTEKINLNTALLGLVYRPTVQWRINVDAELLSADNTFTQIAPRHEQRVRASTVYKVNRWSSVNAGVHFVHTLNNWAANFGGPGVNLFPVAYAPAYGTQSHDRYYTFGVSLHPEQHASLDVGWTYMDQQYSIPACMILTAGVVSGGAPAACPITTNQPTVPATLNVGAGTTPVTQLYRENTNTGYAILTVRPVHRVTLYLGYDITSTSGNDNWYRADNGLPLQVLGDAFGNSPGIPGNPGTVVTGATTSTGTISFLGPFPNQPLGSQTFNWHTLNTGIALGVTKAVTLKGYYTYYDYNEKEGNISPDQLVALPRNFHSNMGTIALKYAF